MRKYKVKITPKLLATLKPFWLAFKHIEGDFHKRIMILEKSMERATGIKGIEFFKNDRGEFYGIGDYGFWTMPLIRRDKLEG